MAIRLRLDIIDRQAVVECWPPFRLPISDFRLLSSVRMLAPGFLVALKTSGLHSLCGITDKRCQVKPAGNLLETWRVEIENMKTVGIDTFTQFQINKLLAAANQCPLSGGDGAFKARSLYSLVDPLVKYDDGALCAPAPEARPKQPAPAASVAKDFQIIPNPAKDELTVRLHKPFKKGHPLCCL